MFTIPNILQLETKGSGRSIGVQTLQETFQEFGEIREIGVLVTLEQPTNHRDEGNLKGVGIDLLGEVLHFLVEARVEVLWRGVISHQNIDMHCFMGGLQIHADCCVGLAQLIQLTKYLPF